MEEKIKQLSIRLEASDLAWAKAQAKAESRSFNGFIQYLIKNERKKERYHADNK